MSIRIISSINPVWYTLSSQTGIKDATKFKITPLTGRQALEVLSGSQPDLMLAIQYGLKDWENVLNNNGEPMAFTGSNIQYLPALTLSEIANEIISISNISGDQEKN